MGGNGPVFDPKAMQDGFDAFVLGKVFELNKDVHHLAHYTSCSTAQAILEDKKLWLNNIRSMNDFDEFVKGASITKDLVVNSTLLGDWYDEDRANLIRQYDAICDLIQDNLYCMSFCYFDKSHDPSDSLEMWQRYGDDCKGVAIVFESDRLLLKQQTQDPLFWLPMIYRSKVTFTSECNKLIEEIDDHYYEAVADSDEEDFIQRAVRIFIINAMIYKNNAYEGEKEFRLVHCPLIHSSGTSSVTIEQKTVKGVDRTVAVVDTERYKSSNGVAIRLSHILDSVILGPKSEKPAAEQSIRATLKNNGLPDVVITASSIPFR